MAEKSKPTKTEAIRVVLEAGVAGDYCDVVDEVKRRYGLTVGEGQVEAAARELQEEASEVAASDQGAAATDPRVTALRFVQAVGGFAAARQALSDLEHELKRLLK